MRRYLCILLVVMYGTLQSSPVGKTHFIMGEPTAIAPMPLHQPSAPVQEIQVLFTPDDNIRHRLLQLINNEREAIYCAVFMMTDPEVANALCAARKRGVRIELITDVGCLKDRASKVNQLCKNGCVVSIYNPTASAKGVSLMHHKFALFAHKSHIWTGSYNFTKAANNNNRENVIIFSDKQTFNKFLDQFKELKSQSYEYTREKISVS